MVVTFPAIVVELRYSGTPAACIGCTLVSCVPTAWFAAAAAAAVAHRHHVENRDASTTPAHIGRKTWESLVLLLIVSLVHSLSYALLLPYGHCYTPHQNEGASPRRADPCFRFRPRPLRPYIRQPQYFIQDPRGVACVRVRQCNGSMIHCEQNTIIWQWANSGRSWFFQTT